MNNRNNAWVIFKRLNKSRFFFSSLLSFLIGRIDCYIIWHIFTVYKCSNLFILICSFQFALCIHTATSECCQQFFGVCYYTADVQYKRSEVESRQKTVGWDLFVNLWRITISIRDFMTIWSIVLLIWTLSPQLYSMFLLIANYYSLTMLWKMCLLVMSLHVLLQCFSSL